MREKREKKKEDASYIGHLLVGSVRLENENSTTTYEISTFREQGDIMERSENVI